MPPVAALPFTLTRSSDVIAAGQITTTRETVHGLLRLDDTHLVVQWRVARATERIGPEIRSDQEVEPVREVRVPLAGLAGAAIRRSRWWPFSTPRLVLIASDLRAFEQVAGEAGLRLGHPAELRLGLSATEPGAAEAFVAELEGALADRMLRAAEAPPTLPPGA